MSKDNSANRIRQRFLQKIGIESSHSPPASEQLPSGPAPQPLSCLGDVVPFREPLKVCLDDCSSLDDSDDEDFFFGDDDEDYEEMDYFSAIDVRNRAPPATSPCLSDTSLDVVPATPLSDQTNHESLPALAPIVSDEGSNYSSHTSLDTIATSTSSFHSSTGTLNQCATDQLACKSDCRGESSGNKKKRKVRLDDEVSVVPIPMRSEYSDRAKERLWSTATELYENAARNSIEFAAEGWDWRTVTEDEHMIYCQESGELIHPIHFHNLLLERGLIPSSSGTTEARTR